MLLLVPLIAQQFTNEVRWTTSDFIVAGGLLFGTGLFSEFILRKVKNIQYRIALVGMLLIIFLLIWIELAVGIF